MKKLAPDIRVVNDAQQMLEEPTFLGLQLPFQIYDFILSSVRKEDSRLIVRTFQWLTFSERPLSVEEMAEAIAIDKASNTRRRIEDLLKLLGTYPSLFTIRSRKERGGEPPSQRTVFLSHHTLWRYLVSGMTIQGPGAPYHMRKEECHGIIAKGCLEYLMQFQQPLSKDVLRSSALARYAAEFWSSHLRKALDIRNEVSQLAVRLLSRKNTAHFNWIRLYDPHHPQGKPNLERDVKSVVGPLHYAALLGLAQVTKLLLNEQSEIIAPSGYHDIPLHAAATEVHLEVVKILLDVGAGCNTQDQFLQNLIQTAIEAGNYHIATYIRYFTRNISRRQLEPSDSGYASQRQLDSLHSQSVPDLEFQKALPPKDNLAIQVPNSSRREIYLDDIRSIDSDLESIGSKISTGRSTTELFAVKYLALFFAQREELRSLHETALQKIERERFTENYRRILKSYYRGLQEEASNDTEQVVTRTLRSRRNRESIAVRIADEFRIEEEEVVSFNHLLSQRAEREHLGDWLKRT